MNETPTAQTNGAASATKPGSNRAEIVQAIRDAANGEHTLSVEAAGKLLGLSRDAAYRAAKNNTLRTIKVSGRRWRVSVAVIEKLLLGD